MLWEKYYSEWNWGNPSKRYNIAHLLLQCNAPHNKSLAQAQEKIHALEEQLDQLLKTKNAAIHELESLVRRLERELQLAIEKVEEMRETLEHRRGEGEGEGERGEGWEREMASLLESINALSQQLMAALEQCR